MLNQAIKAVQEGGDPANVHFDADKALVKVGARNLYRVAETAK